MALFFNNVGELLRGVSALDPSERKPQLFCYRLSGYRTRTTLPRLDSGLCLRKYGEVVYGLATRAATSVVSIFCPESIIRAPPNWCAYSVIAFTISQTIRTAVMNVLCIPCEHAERDLEMKSEWWLLLVSGIRLSLQRRILSDGSLFSICHLADTYFDHLIKTRVAVIYIRRR